MNLDYLSFEQPIAELEAKIEELQLVGNDNELNIAEEVTKLREKSRKLTQNIYAKLTPWQVVQVARHPHRPYALDYIHRIFSDWEEMHGDRHFGDDSAIVGGVARLGNSPVMIIGQEKGRGVTEKVMRNLVCQKRRATAKRCV
jgi:acetyl-CoA carboxylase carboxyl transferase subunit alpha